MDISINFISNALPSLVAGKYEIAATQAMSNSTGLNTEGYFSPSVVQAFYVDAPQFSLPAQLLGSTFPATDGLGDFTWTLPQVQVLQPSLPWARKVTGAPETVPWMALIVLRDDEMQWAPNAQSPIFNTTRGSLATLPSNVFFPPFTRNSLSEDDSTPVQTIRVRTAAFAAVMPRQDEVAYLSHCREVVSTPANRTTQVTRTTATVLANRFPPSSVSGRCHCFLVSLENFYAYLVSNPAFPTAATGANGAIQLVVLRHWSFVSQPGGMTTFVNGLSGAGGATRDLLLRVPVNTASLDSNIAWRLQAGYVPVEYAVSNATSTFAWYRGPLTAAVPQPVPVDLRNVASSDQAMIYSEAEGVFDQSYAAAWEMGRSLALADPDFAMDLQAFRQRSYRLLALLSERLQFADFRSQQDYASVVASNAVYNAFDASIATELTRLMARVSVDGLDQYTPTPHPRATPEDPTPAAILARQILAEPRAVQAIATLVSQDLVPVAAWLAALQLLVRVPFHHLVPDQRMLPQNSIRVFYMDQNWLDSLLAGAKSVGIEGSQDTYFYEAMRGVIDDAVQQEMEAYMSKLLGVPTGDKLQGYPKEAMSGMLIRSSLVGQYENFLIEGRKAGQQLQILRMEKLSDTVLLVIFRGLVDEILISEPSAEISTGADEGFIFLRATTSPLLGMRNGSRFPEEDGTFAQFYRNTSADPNVVGARTLNVAIGLHSLTAELAETLKKSPFYASDLALQLTETPDYFQFSTHLNV